MICNRENKSFEKNMIPKIIHQIWENEKKLEVPVRLRILADTWRINNPQWKYHLWETEEINNLVKNEFPYFRSTYESLKYPIQRLDVIRYLILYTYGGVYTDLDTECFQPLDDLFKCREFCFGEEPEGNNIHLDLPHFVGNAFMASTQNHPGWLTILEEIQIALEKKYKVQLVLNTTGPLMISRIFDTLQRKYGAELLASEMVSPVTKREVYNYIRGYDCFTFEKKIEKAVCVHYYFGLWEKEFAFYK